MSGGRWVVVSFGLSPCLSLCEWYLQGVEAFQETFIGLCTHSRRPSLQLAMPKQTFRMNHGYWTTWNLHRSIKGVFSCF